MDNWIEHGCWESELLSSCVHSQHFLTCEMYLLCTETAAFGVGEPRRSIVLSQLIWAPFVISWAAGSFSGPLAEKLKGSWSIIRRHISSRHSSQPSSTPTYRVHSLGFTAAPDVLYIAHIYMPYSNADCSFLRLVSDQAWGLWGHSEWQCVKPTQQQARAPVSVLCFFYSVLGVEPSALHMLSSHTY